MGLRFRARFWTKLPFSGFLLPSTSEWEPSTPLDETSSLKKIICSLPKPFRKSPCSKPCWIIASSEPFQGYSPVWHSLPTLSKSECIIHNLEGTHDRRIAINRFPSFLVASPRSLPSWSLSHTSFIGFAFCISLSVGHQVAPCLWC
jgi:hypothetical protein